MAKIRLGIVFGGKSGEHEVSIRSAESIRNNLDKSKYEIVDIFIDKLGTLDFDKFKNIDVFFPIIHGTYGEDGSLQGFFELLNVAYVGPGVLGSAVGMDKDVSKRLLQCAGIKVADFVVLRDKQEFKKSLSEINKLGLPVYVKPVNMGSSVGISKVNQGSKLERAVDDAFAYDLKVIIEAGVVGREVECSVLGNATSKVSVAGEVKTPDHFYDYKSKYINENGAELIVPADLTVAQMKKVQQTALMAYKILECSGMARVDMFITNSDEVFINEINTLPGFTSISMYPKLWEASGLAYTDLLDKLIQLAIEIKQKKDNLKRSYE